MAKRFIGWTMYVIDSLRHEPLRLLPQNIHSHIKWQLIERNDFSGYQWGDVYNW